MQTPTSYHEPPLERRPLTSRSTWWAAAMSTALVRIGATPNGISTLGLAFGCLAGVAFAATTWCSESPGSAAERCAFAAAAGFVQLRLLCNLLDGMVAVEGGRRSAVGELFNEAPDRISDAAMLVGAGYAAGSTDVWGWAAACVAVWVAYVRALAKSAGAPNDFCGPMAKPHRAALITGAAVFLAAAPVDWRPQLGLMNAALAVVVVGGAVTSVRRLLRAASFLRGAR